MHFTVFHSTDPDTLLWVGEEFPDNSVFKGQNLLSFIIQPSKTKTFCQNHQKHQNLLSFIIQPSKTKTFCQNHQKHQNLLSKHQNHQNLLSKHQNHQNHLSKSSKPPVKNIKTYCHDNMIYNTGSPAYTGSPALYRKSLLYRRSRLIQEVPPIP